MAGHPRDALAIGPKQRLVAAAGMVGRDGVVGRPSGQTALVARRPLERLAAQCAIRAGLTSESDAAATQRSQRAERAIKQSAMREQPQNPANLRM